MHEEFSTRHLVVSRGRGVGQLVGFNPWAHPYFYEESLPSMGIHEQVGSPWTAVGSHGRADETHVCL